MTVDFAWLDFATDFEDVDSLAETIELMLIFEREPYLALSELRDRFPFGNQPSDTQMMLAVGAIQERRADMGRLYPFVRRGRGVAFRESDPWHLYGMLLLLSFKNTQLRVDADWPRSDELFDSVVRRAALAKLGREARAVVFGFPPRGERPSNFPDAVEWVAGQMGVGLRVTKSSIPSHHNDAGVDVIAWAPFPDRRTGFPIYLIQNTIQFSYVTKPRDVRPSRWRDWVALGTTPSVGFGIPFLVPRGHAWWDEVAAEVGMFLERSRIVELLRKEDPTKWDNWAQIEQFVEDELRDAPSAAETTGKKVRAGRAPAPKKKKAKKGSA